MFKCPKSRVILSHDHHTDYFDCTLGVKQGDSISPTLFACFVNDLSKEIKEKNVGVNITINNSDNNTFKVSNLLYADDVVLLAETEQDLQEMLNVTNSWCNKWRMEVNLTKTNILHIRKKSQPRSTFRFKLGEQIVKYCEEYKYLGITLNEYLDYKFSTDILSDSGGRALSSIITKMIKHGGFPLNVYKKLFDSCVCSVSDYGGEIWGFKAYESNRQLQLKACRAYLGVPKQTAIPGLLSEMNWCEPRSRTQVQMIRYFHRLLKIDDQRLIKRVYIWDRQLNDSGLISTWSSEVKDILQRNGQAHIFTQFTFPKKILIRTIGDSLLKKDQITWQSSCTPLPKLRTFIQFKDFSCDAPHIFKPLTFMQRKSLSKFRLGLLHLRIETGRFIRPRLPPEDRVCLICNSGEVENEIHFLLFCNKYVTQRQTLFSHIPDLEGFLNLDSHGKLKFLVNDPAMVKKTAKFIVSAYEYRSTLL